jgi:hypothetical protein
MSPFQNSTAFQGAPFINLTSRYLSRFQVAAELDRRADRELAEGRHRIAEMLSRQAAEMREVAQ